MLSAVLVGVLTGIAANLLTHLFVRVGLPAYRDFVYRGVRLSGSWAIVQELVPIDGQPLGNDWKLTATLTQQANKLSGHATAVRTQHDNPDAIDILEYVVEGHVLDRFVMIQMHSESRARIAHSSFHLEVKSDGSIMVGYRTFFGLKMDVLRAVPCAWKRPVSSQTIAYEKAPAVIGGGDSKRTNESARPDPAGVESLEPSHQT